MAQTYFLKNVPSPLRSLIRPMLVLSLGLHALILFVPLQGEKQPEPLKEEEKQVKITQLPTVRPSPKPAAVKRRAPTRKITTPRRTTTATPPAVAPTRSTEASTTTPTVQAAKDPFIDFPHHPASTTGCYGKEACREVKGTKIDAVVSYFQKALPGKKFLLSLVANEPARKVFQVSKSEQSLFLSIFQDGSNTVYVLAPEEINSLNDLKGAVEVPSALYELLAELPSADNADPNDPAASNTIARPEDFQQPQLFFKTTGSVASDGSIDNPELLSGIDGAPQIAGGGEEPQFFFQTFFEQRLSEIFDEVTPDGEYGGGLLYRLKKGSTTIYLNLVPKKVEKGTPPDTIVVVWTRSPK
jgi:hypothetical protein